MHPAGDCFVQQFSDRIIGSGAAAVSHILSQNYIPLGKLK